jgi:hypothetical protein
MNFKSTRGSAGLGAITTIIVIIVLVFLGNCACNSVKADRYDMLKEQAIKLGYAEYVMDPLTGDTTWQWQDPQGILKGERK